MFLTNDKRCQNQYLRSRGLENVIEKFYQYLRMFCKINNCKTIAIYDEQHQNVRNIVSS